MKRTQTQHGLWWIRETEQDRRKSSTLNYWHSDVNKDLESEANAKDKGHKGKSKAFNYQGQDQGLEMSRSMVEIKANNNHKIYMHSEVLANAYDSQSLFNIFAQSRTVKPLVKNSLDTRNADRNSNNATFHRPDQGPQSWPMRPSTNIN